MSEDLKNAKARNELAAYLTEKKVPFLAFDPDSVLKKLVEDHKAGKLESRENPSVPLSLEIPEEILGLPQKVEELSRLVADLKVEVEELKNAKATLAGVNTTATVTGKQN